MIMRYQHRLHINARSTPSNTCSHGLNAAPQCGHASYALVRTSPIGAGLFFSLFNAILRFKNNSSILMPIHFYNDWFGKPDKPGEILFFQRRLCKQPIPIQKTVFDFGIHGEVADHERRDVLKEMRSLRGRNIHIFETRFHNSTRTRNLIPSDRNT